MSSRTGSQSGKTAMQAGEEGRQGTATTQTRERRAGRQPWKARRRARWSGAEMHAPQAAKARQTGQVTHWRQTRHGRPYR